MKRLILLLVCLSVFCLAGPYTAGAQDVGTPISSLPYTISEPGFYYITGDLTAPPSSASITVEANNVTIDLMGYSIIGSTGVEDGVYMNGRSNVEVRNGTIRGFMRHGIHEESSSSNHRIINVRVVGNNASGIVLDGHGHLVKDCTVSDNRGRGISVHYGCTVTGNTAFNNGAEGIDAKNGCTITGNTVSRNRDNGIAIGDGCTVTGNTIYYNKYIGISAKNGCTITGNTIFNNRNKGISASHGCTVTGNTAYKNGETGIIASSGSTLTANTANDNGGSGIYGSGNGSTITGNTAFNNQKNGIQLIALQLVDGNTAYLNNQSGGNYKNIETCTNCTFGLNLAP